MQTAYRSTQKSGFGRCYEDTLIKIPEVFVPSTHFYRSQNETTTKRTDFLKIAHFIIDALKSRFDEQMKSGFFSST
jgi:hypothetical protein